MKIFTSAQIHELDKYTIEHEPISSLNLMERAAKALTRAIEEEWSNRTPVVVFAGPGNNGGDALAVAQTAQRGRISGECISYSTCTTSSLPTVPANKKRLIEGKARQDLRRSPSTSTLLSSKQERSWWTVSLAADSTSRWRADSLPW